jgi:UDP-N-acetylmuramoyl-L-alanyl-D-glutamate--2,6-diaminopimelate ligase
MATLSDPNDPGERRVRWLDLLSAVNGTHSQPGADPWVTGIALDSRQVKPGNLFVALVGGTNDGHHFIPDAIARGASAVVGTASLPALPVPYCRVEDSRLALAKISAAFYGFPARRLVMIGVTGTDGKTTTASLIYEILKACGIRAGIISTVYAVIGDRRLDTGLHVTTPEAPDIQHYLAQMTAAGINHVVLEATSHGLSQRRVAACEFDIGVVTNITHEHLDYHGSYEAYRAAKGILFEGLSETKPKRIGEAQGAVLNRDDRSYEYLRKITRVPSLSYGLGSESDVRAENIQHDPDGLVFDGITQGARFPVKTFLVGTYNVLNCLAAIAATAGILSLPVESVQRGIAALTGVPGRMERIDVGQKFLAFVDFAHTPNALRRALEAGREMIRQGRVIAVFGSAGLRDRAKRRMMAQTSADLADLTILTAEDPRSESLEAILAEMASGAAERGAREGKDIWRIPDRGDALRFAVSLASPDDIVIACGKGHEQSMCFGEKEYPWDDRTALRAALAEYLGLPGPQMPWLPTSDRD